MKRVIAWIAVKLVIFTLATVGAVILALLAAMIVYFVGLRFIGGPEAVWRQTGYLLPAPAVIGTIVAFAIHEFVVRPIRRSPPGSGVICLVGTAPAFLILAMMVLQGGLEIIPRSTDIVLTLIATAFIATTLLAVRIRMEDALFS